MDQDVPLTQIALAVSAADGAGDASNGDGGNDDDGNNDGQDLDDVKVVIPTAAV